MEENFFKISFDKVMEMILIEERQKIHKFILDTLGKATADIFDTYTPTESATLKLFSTI